MKRTKRIFAIFMTIALAMSMLIVSSAVSFAAPDTAHTIKITSDATQKEDHAYEAYQVFVGTYDKNAVDLTFTNQGLQVSSKASSGVEILPYVTSDNQRDFTCSVDILMLVQEVKAISNDLIEIYYGDESSIKLIDGNITIVIALMEDEE